MKANQLRSSMRCGFFTLAIFVLALEGRQAFAAEADAEVKKTSGSYLSSERKINVVRFEPGRPGYYPAILLLHGIDGADTNEASYHLSAKRLAANGYVVFFVHYFDAFAERPKDLAFFKTNIEDYLKTPAGPDGERLKRSFRECLATVGDGIKYARAQQGVDGQRVGMVGFSLGAFLALSAATQEDMKITAVVELFGGLPEDKRQQAKALPPVLVLHGDKDQIVSVDTARSLEKLLKGNEIVHEIEVYKGVGHVFDDGKGGLCLRAVFDAENRATKFLQKHLKQSDLKNTASRHDSEPR